MSFQALAELVASQFEDQESQEKVPTGSGGSEGKPTLQRLPSFWRLLAIHGLQTTLSRSASVFTHGLDPCGSAFPPLLRRTLVIGRRAHSVLPR